MILGLSLSHSFSHEEKNITFVLFSHLPRPGFMIGVHTALWWELRTFALESSHVNRPLVHVVSSHSPLIKKTGFGCVCSIGLYDSRLVSTLWLEFVLIVWVLVGVFCSVRILLSWNGCQALWRTLSLLATLDWRRTCIRRTPNSGVLVLCLSLRVAPLVPRQCSLPLSPAVPGASGTVRRPLRSACCRCHSPPRPRPRRRQTTLPRCLTLLAPNSRRNWTGFPSSSIR